jgi:hypothetical protein
MAQPLGSGVRLVFWVVALLTGVTGLVMFLLPDLAGSTLWPWRLTPLLSRYLGGLFIGVAVGALLSARATDWSQVRLLFPPGLTFTALSLVAAVLHTGSFDPGRRATWAFFVVYLAVFLAGLLTYLRYERERAARAASAVTGVLNPGSSPASRLAPDE